MSVFGNLGVRETDEHEYESTVGRGNARRDRWERIGVWNYSTAISKAIARLNDTVDINIPFLIYGKQLAHSFDCIEDATDK